MRTPNQPISAEALSYNVAFLNGADITPLPDRSSRQRNGRNERRQSRSSYLPLPRRSSSVSSPTDNATIRTQTTGSSTGSFSRRRFGHSRNSSGSQASRSSHETAQTSYSQASPTIPQASRQADRPAAAAAAGLLTPYNKSALGPPAVAAAAADFSPSIHQLPWSTSFHPPSAFASPSPSSTRTSPNLNRNSLAPHRHRSGSGLAANGLHGVDMNASNPSAESVSSASGTTSLSTRTTITSDNQVDNPLLSRPFVQRNGRTYLNDATLPYPLPSDLTELHRQSLRTLLLIQLFGAPVCSPSLTKKPPQRVLEVGCGSGFWSMMCHRYFKGRGYGHISFTGVDISPVSPGSSGSPSEATKPDRDMQWKFVNHDLRQLPWPLPSEEYDLVMIKDMSLASTNQLLQNFIDEYLRLLRPGGTLEIWESDHLIRMLRPHVPGSATTMDDADEQEAASSLGAYVISSNTPLSAPLNQYFVEYNTWLARALEARDLNPVPCTLIGPMLLQESETVTEVRSRRLAIPLSEVRWEREGVGGVVTRDGKLARDGRSRDVKTERTLTAGQIALRKTALLTVVQQVQALEPVLREVSGKSQDEWDVWLGKMMSDMMSDSGVNWGECLEVGAWWAKKRKRRSQE